MADLNFEGNRSFSSNYFCSGKFVIMHKRTNQPCIVMLNEMLTLYSSTLFCVWKTFRTKKEHFCALSENAVFSIKLTHSVPHLHTTQWKVDKLKYAYVLNSTVWYRDTCMSTMKFWPCFQEKCKFCVCLPWRRQKLVQPISFWWLAKVASGNRKPTSEK